MKDVKHMVHLLHTALHLPDHHILKERELLEKLDGIKQELSPLEKVFLLKISKEAAWPHGVSVCRAAELCYVMDMFVYILYSCVRSCLR